MGDAAKNREPDEFKPPYVPFRTLLNLLLKMQGEPVPPRIDRSYLGNMSGATQTHLMSALRAFALIDEEGRVQRTLLRMAEGDEQRREAVRDLLSIYYAEQVRLAEQNATQALLVESFDRYGLASEPKRKAITFFLNGAQYAGLPLSPHFKLPRERAARSTGTRKASRKKGMHHPPAKADTAPATSSLSSQDEAKQRYLDLLLKRVETEGTGDAELLNRIERLLGFDEKN